MGWRDIKLILAHSADKNDPYSSGWKTNAAGVWFNSFYGFGQLNIQKAVDLAAQWKVVGPLRIYTSYSTFTLPVIISPSGYTRARLNFPHGMISKIESVQLMLAGESNQCGYVKRD